MTKWYVHTWSVADISCKNREKGLKCIQTTCSPRVAKCAVIHRGVTSYYSCSFHFHIIRTFQHILILYEQSTFWDNAINLLILKIRKVTKSALNFQQVTFILFPLSFFAFIFFSLFTNTFPSTCITFELFYEILTNVYVLLANIRHHRL